MTMVTATKKCVRTASNFIALIPPHQMLVNFSEGLYQSLEKENDSHCLVFTSSTKHDNIRQFYVLLVQ